MRETICCPFRHQIRKEGETETAVCRLLRQLTGLRQARLCRVRRDACAACAGSFVASAEDLNPVLAALLHELAETIGAAGGLPGCSADEAAALRQWAEGNLAFAEGAVAWVAADAAAAPDCDVILCCPDSSKLAEWALRSVLAQEGLATWVHLIDDGGGGRALLERYGGHPRILTRRNPARWGPLETLHQLVPLLRTEYVALQDPTTTSRPHRLCAAVGMLAASGADLFGSALTSPAGIIAPLTPAETYRRCIPAETLVWRRAALADMGGVAPRAVGLDVELVHRAALERRRILLTAAVLVDAHLPWAPPPPGPPPRYAPREGRLRHHVRRFGMETIACDVVLPFHGQLPFVREALESLLDQEGAEPVIHLIDDASPEDTSSFLRFWASHRRVRTYRNERNLGQFISFNNVLPFLETSLVAVQDADDISLPHRLHYSGNLLRLAGAELFGGRTRLFGDARLSQGVRQEPPLRRGELGYRCSRVPVQPGGYFLEHPTAVLRVETFTALGGFADLGSLHANRCSLDTEFALRAYYSGRRFAISREPVLRYRCHRASATRDDQTGWGTEPRSQAEAECQRRLALFRQGGFEPAAFGALRRHGALTRRLGGASP